MSAPAALANKRPAQPVASALPRQVLFLVDALRTFEQHREIARALEATGGWECWFMPIAEMGAGDLPQSRICRLHPAMRHGAADPDQPVAPDRTRSKAASAVQALLKRRAMTVPRTIILAVIQACRWRSLRKAARVRLLALRASAIIISQERDERALPIIAAARDLAIPVILVPVAGLYMPDGSAFLRRDNRDVMLDPAPGTVVVDWGQIRLNRLVGWLQPGHVFASRWGRMLFQPAHWYFAAWLSGLGLRSSWFHGTRFADAIVVSGDDELRVCRAAGIPNERIAAIGNPALQIVHDSRQHRMQIRARLQLAPNEKLLILALPQLWEQGMMSREEHFSESRKLLDVFRDVGYSVLVSLHPKMDPANYEASVKAVGARIAHRPLIELLTAADGFVAGAYSSTIRWALATGIPCVNIDVWDLNESTYRDDPEYPTVRSLAALRTWIAETLTCPTQPPLQSRLPLGLVCDGDFSRRMIELVERLAAEPSGLAPLRPTEAA